MGDNGKGSYQLAATFFGASKGGRGLDPASLYAREVPLADTGGGTWGDYWDREPSFDVSNNVMRCSCGPDGLPRRLATVAGAHDAVGQGLVGVYVHKDILRADITFSLTRPSRPALATAWRSTTLWHGLFPYATFAFDDLDLRVLTFAPVPEGYSSSPPAVLVCLELTNRDEEAHEVELRVEHGRWALDRAEELAHGQDARAGLVSVSTLTEGLEVVHGSEGSVVRGKVPAGTTSPWALAVCLGETLGSVASAVATLSALDAQGWLEATERRLTGRVGGLGTGPEGYDGALFVRQVELCRQALAYGRDGTLAGGFLGSEVNNRPEVWMRDCFYAALPLAWFAPEICADAASFFTANGRPGKAWGRGVGRFEPHAGPAHSIGNAVAAIVLAGAYLRATGDVEWLRRCPQPYEYGVSLFDSLGRLRGPDVLFPSLYVSDGDARGDWHTGSNILVWRALMDMADMAGHALGDGAAAEHWRAEATTLHAAIVDRCAGPGPEGMQFYEGAFRDGSFVAGHDGEESDLTLASHYGFTAAHDPLVLTHSRLAFCAENPLYWPPLDGVQWWDSEVCFGPTFPAYIHRLAGAQSERDLGSDLSQLRTLADVDGSFWWWPYRPFATDTSHIARGIAKSSWAAGVFVCRMVSDVLGVRANALTRRLSVRPFCPWSYHWTAARLGAIAFDVEYTMSDSGRHLAVRNKSGTELRLDLEVVGPGPQAPRRVVVDGRGQPETWAVGWRFGRRTVTAGAVLAAGQQLELRCSWGGGG